MRNCISVFILLFSISAMNGFSAEVSIDWNTFAGSSGVDSGTSVCIGHPQSGNNIYTTGYSYRSWDIAKYGTPILSKEGIDDEEVIHVASFTPEGDLRWYTFLGNGSFDRGNSIAINDAGHLIVAGNASGEWPVAKYGVPVQAYNASGTDIFIARLDTDGNLLWHTFLGSSDFHAAFSVEVIESTGRVYVTGESYDSWDTSKYGDPVKDFSGDHDIFVACLNLRGELQWYTFPGGSGGDVGKDIFYARGNLYITGYSDSNWDTVKFGNSLTSYNGGKDIVLAKLNGSGELQWYNYYGGPGNDFGNAISGNPGSGETTLFYVTGGSAGEWDENEYAEPGISYNGGGDIVVFSCSDSGNMGWYSFYGSDWSEQGTGIRWSLSGDLYVSGTTSTTGWNYSTWDTGKYGRYYLFGPMDLNPKAVIFRANTHGITEWNVQVSHQSSNDWGNGLAIDINDRIYMIGEALSDDWGYQQMFPEPLYSHNDREDQMLISFTEEFTIHAVVMEGPGSVSPQSQQIAINGSGSIKFKSPKGYELSSIIDNGVSMPLSNPFLLNNVREDHTIEIDFSIESYHILCSVSGGNGSVKARENKVKFGETAYVDIYPDPGFEIGSINDNGINILIANPYVIENVNTDHTIEVTFNRKFYPPTLNLAAVRSMESAWILKKEYAELSVSITEHTMYPLEISRFVLYRTMNGTKTELTSWKSTGFYSYTDISIKNGIPVGYELIALTPSGEIAATSGVITI